MATATKSKPKPQIDPIEGLSLFEALVRIDRGRSWDERGHLSFTTTRFKSEESMQNNIKHLGKLSRFPASKLKGYRVFDDAMRASALCFGTTCRKTYDVDKAYAKYFDDLTQRLDGAFNIRGFAKRAVKALHDSSGHQVGYNYLLAKPLLAWAEKNKQQCIWLIEAMNNEMDNSRLIQYRSQEFTVPFIHDLSRAANTFPALRGDVLQMQTKSLSLTMDERYFSRRNSIPLYDSTGLQTRAQIFSQLKEYGLPDQESMVAVINALYCNFTSACIRGQSVSTLCAMSEKLLMLLDIDTDSPQMMVGTVGQDEDRHHVGVYSYQDAQGDLKIAHAMGRDGAAVTLLTAEGVAQSLEQDGTMPEQVHSTISLPFTSSFTRSSDTKHLQAFADAMRGANQDTPNIGTVMLGQSPCYKLT